MKRLNDYIAESVFDVDNNIDKLEIPAKPKVSKDDYPAYEQAWHDALVELLAKSRRSRDYAIFFKIYKEWLSDWSCHLSIEDYDYEYDSDVDWYTDYINFVHRSDDRKYLEMFIDDLIDECKEGASRYRMSPQSSGSFRYALYDTEDVFADELEKHTFSNKQFASAYRKFKKDIDKVLSVNIG